MFSPPNKHWRKQIYVFFPGGVGSGLGAGFGAGGVVTGPGGVSQGGTGPAGVAPGIFGHGSIDPGGQRTG